MIPRHSRLHQPAVGLLPQRYLIGGRRVTPRITQRPFVLGPCPASDTHGGCIRQAALWAGGTPGAAPALLLRRLPGEARAERKGRSTRCRSSAMLFPVHAVDSGGQCVCAPADLPFPESCQLPYCVRKGEARLHTAGDRFTKRITDLLCC